ncbi:MAG: hypothetical protein ACSW8I_09390 [bacterium]
MKKNIFAIAVAAFALCMASCQKDEPINIIPTGNGGNTTPTENNARVKSTSDLHNTDWTYTMTYSEFLSNLLGLDTSCMGGIEDKTMEFGLSFDGTFAHFSFPDNVMAFGGDEGMLEQIYGVSYTYSYEGTTHTGYLDGVADDEDDEEPAQLQFTYDDATDVITFNLNMFFAEDGTPITLTLDFARNE